MTKSIFLTSHIGALEKDALNILRWLSTFAIVICHILQAKGNIFAYTFNAAVQIFFLLSGYLYGGRRITNFKKFYWGRFKKLYIPFFIWSVISAILLYISVPDRISLSSFVAQITMRYWLPGQEHLWFMQVIFICYLILPFVDLILTKNVSLPIICSIILIGIILNIHYTPTIIWVILYFVGYAMGRWKFLVPYVMIASIIITLCLIRDYGLVLTLADSSIIGTVCHASFGTALFTLFLLFLSNIHINRKISSACNLPGTYEIYLTHPIFIWGSFSLLMLTDSSILNCVLVVSAIIIISIGLYYFSKYIIAKFR